MSMTDQDLAEEDALLTGQRTTLKPSNRWKKYREIGFFIWALLATIVVVVLAVVFHRSQNTAQPKDKHTGKRNLIFMVSDGMGPTSLSLTRSFRQYTQGLPWTDALVIDKHIIGQSRTRSSSSFITDSAAGATAFSCGKKSYNGAISILPDHTPCGTVMEAAKNAGYLTGLVVTTRITDATPACFAAHVAKREYEDRIAEQLLGEYPLGLTVDLMLGAGRCHFLPNNTAGSCRSDDRDLRKVAETKGINYIDNRRDFDVLKLGSAVKLPILGLFADHDIPYEVDRRFEEDTYPSLEEMAKTALAALSEATKDSEKGFFLMIEGSRIDHAGHANDPVAQVHEVLAYDRTMQVVLDFLEKDQTDGLMISTSDHETGGLATARQLHPYVYPEYQWYPSVLANASHSAEWLTIDYLAHLQHPSSSSSSSSSSASASASSAESYIRRVLPEYLGIHDATPAEISLLVDHPELSPYSFADMISRRSQTGWATHGHSAADVNIYTSDAGVAGPKLGGSRENTEVGEFLAGYLGVDVEAVTRELREKSGAGGVGAEGEVAGASAGFNGYAWMGELPGDTERLDGQTHVDLGLGHYEGDFKKHRRCEICGGV